MNADDGCKDIAAQLVDENGFINLVMGGGWSKFLNNSDKSINRSFPENGDRIDGRNLIEAWRKLGANYKFIYNKTDFLSLKPNLDEHILGILFTYDFGLFFLIRIRIILTLNSPIFS